MRSGAAATTVLSVSESSHLLVTVTGSDHPGITAALSAVVADCGAALLDIEQVVLQQQLTLCLLVDTAGSDQHGKSVLGELAAVADRMNLGFTSKRLNARVSQTDIRVSSAKYAVTAIGDQLGAKGLSTIADVLAKKNANIESIRRLSRGELLSLEVICTLPNDEVAKPLRKELASALKSIDVDVAVQPERLTRRSKRLVLFDMDSTLIQIEVIDELARMHGVVDKVSAITHRAMSGEIDFEGSLRERVGLLKGLRYESVLKLAKELPVTDGVPELLRVLKKLGLKTGVISGGFMFAAETLKERLGLDYAYANRLEIKDGVLTGKVIDPVVTPQRKADLLQTIAQSEGISLDQTVAIGDGANDLTMLENASLGIAFCAKPKLKEAADTSVSAGGLDRVLYLLGLDARDIADALES